eukprot:TRINITY_DN36515_c0_g1_i1.p1 TRINITY_DN36515_c0_g1~~TRINITY_DN36515_c0_g1_i1.p1  ORF type:complete len:638 (-),score=132.10 TRINITY_DN36515_c0_g1_i1:78-1991(-)
MMEVIRLVSVAPLDGSAVIFNMNGAEESILQAAHGFVSSHKEWAPSVRTMINLEGFGGGGRELVLQTGPQNGWIASAYAASAPYPFANTIAEEIFQSGVIAGDTDFRVYRDFGGIPGIDMVFVSENGHVYHTVRDDISHIRIGSLQHCGENVVAVLRALSLELKFHPVHDSKLGQSAINSNHPLKDQRVVYYDILGQFMLIYSESVSGCVNLSVAVATLLWARHHQGWLLGRALVCVIGSNTAAFLAPISLGLLLDYFCPMVWFGCPSTVPVMFGALSLSALIFARKRLETSIPLSDPLKREDLLFSAAAVSSAVVIIFGTCISVRSVYLLSWQIAFPLLARAILHRLSKQPTPSALLAAHTLGSVPTFLILAQYYLIMHSILFPLVGRSGTELPPSVLAGLICGLYVSLGSVTLSTLTLSPPGGLSRAARCGLLVSAGVLGVLVLGRLAFSVEVPKRIFMQNVLRRYHSEDGTINREDGGLWVNAMDMSGLGPVEPYIQGLSTAAVVNCSDVPSHRYCEMPWYFPLSFAIKNGRYVEHRDVAQGFPGWAAPVRVNLVAEHKMDGVRRLEFAMHGPSHMSAVLPNTLSGWSLGKLPPTRPDCDCHWVFYLSLIHISEPTRLLSISYAVFCLKKKKKK